MLALRDAHTHGATRVSIDGRHIFSGGADGTVSLFSTVMWSAAAAALWSFRCHEAAVTDVVLAEALALAISCGRDGRIILHENIFDSTTLVSRAICQVTGEVRCLQLDAARRRLYIAGDSLRCLDMSQAKFQIHTIPLLVPFPIVSLAISPCGTYLAMASASGDVGVVNSSSAAPNAAETASTAARKIKFIFHSVLSSTARRDDTVRYRMTWCDTTTATASSTGRLLLMVPTSAEVEVYELEEDRTAGATSLPRMRAIGGLQDRQVIDLVAALAYRISKTRLACLLVSREGLYVGKVETKTLAMSRHASERYGTLAAGAEEGRAAVAAITDVQVNSVSGDVVVGLADGRISLLRKVSLKAPKLRSDAAVESIAATAATNGVDADEGAVSGRRGGGAAADKARRAGSSRRRHRHGGVKTRAGARGIVTGDARDDSFLDDGSDDDTASVSSVDSSTTSATVSSSAISSSSESGVAPENFEEVVEDLQRSGASVHANDVERSSRWRAGDQAAALAQAEREMERQRVRSRFLDDEAEEASTDDDDDDEEGGFADRGSDATHAPRARGGYIAQNRGDAFEDVDEDDDASVQGHAQSEEGEEEEEGAKVLARRSGHPQLLASRASVLHDYSFQVGATPMGKEGSCYLAYNSVGYILYHREGTTVHFHDISYPAVRVPLRDTVLMGALSPVGACFAVAPADPTEVQGSVDEVPRLSIFYHAFTALGAQSEWRVPLSPGEAVRCMAAGIRFVAVATSHYLRIFSLTGLELAVLSKCQRIVTMVGTSSRTLMRSFKADFDPLVLMTLAGTGELQMEVMDVGARAAALAPRTVPLTELPDGSAHQLQWLGWSEDGFLHVVDTAGVVRMFTESWGGTWVPVYDPRAVVDQSYALWVYGISENALLAYRYARDDVAYPAAVASGLLTEHVPLFLPLTRSMTEEGLGRWDRVLRQQLRSDELKRRGTFYSSTIAQYDAVHDAHLLHFFDVALKEQQTTRAVELAMLMEIHDRVVQCAKKANAQGYGKLVPKLMALYEMRVSTKQKRKCALPMREALLTDQKKNELLQRLLKPISQQEKSEIAANGAAAVPATAESNNLEGVPGGEAAESGKRDSPIHVPATATSPPTTPRSDTYTATTVDTLAPPAPVRRRVSFAKDVGAAPSSPSATLKTAVTSTPTSEAGEASVPARKVANPFAAPTARPGVPSTPTLLGSPAPAPASPPPPPSSHHLHQSRLPLVGAAARHTATPFPSAAGADALLGASQAVTPPRATVPVGRTAAAVHVKDTAVLTAAAGSTPEELRVSAGRSAAISPPPPPRPQMPSAMPSAPSSEDGRSTAAASPVGDGVLKAAAPPTERTPSFPHFVARALPDWGGAVAKPVFSGSIDPFVEPPSAHFREMTEREVLGDAGATMVDCREASISVRSLLDEGHHDETIPVVRSDSFGEALRKRYREDETLDSDEEADGRGVTSVPKLAL